MTYDILKYVITGLISAIVGLIVYTINNINKTQAEIVKQLTDQNLRLTKVETEHEFIIKNRCGANG